MFKTHGRLKPADKKEHSNTAGKQMICHTCGKVETISTVVFAETRCGECGDFMVEVGVEQAKLTGKK